ncbi:MAG: hypothetical protein LC115_12420 [Bacteroidia bacterium]|nr:hypothetical protein [Bacteroidia bacterium]
MNTNSISLCCPAKVNLGLFIKGKRPDGYHEIETIFLKVPDLYDTLSVQLSDNPECQIRITEDLPFKNSFEIADLERNNIIKRVWEGMQSWNKTPFLGVNVQLVKRIPLGAGLGGGSSNAYSMFDALKKLYQIQETEEFWDFERHFLASLGADVPAFGFQTPVLATGIGTTLQPIQLTIPGKITIFPQHFHSDTKSAYQNLDLTNCTTTHSLSELVNLPVNTWQQNIINDFEVSVFERFPKLHEAKEALLAQDFLYVSMSGSGSALFAIESY